jgi:superfamily II DNA/RNA helicase
LAYLLPTLSLAIARAEAEVEAAAAAAATLSRRQKRSGTAPPVGSVQAIVVAPSRELAMQIVRVAQSLLPPGARGAVQQCIGGANPHRQVREELRCKSRHVTTDMWPYVRAWFLRVCLQGACY